VFGIAFAEVSENKTRKDLMNMAQQNDQQNENSNAIKDPDEWTTGEEPMTGAQKSYLKTLSDEAGEEFDETLTKADASKRIDELQQKTGRGADNNGGNG
jgi:hypothetical protein